jgi:hypothetical protein
MERTEKKVVVSKDRARTIQTRAKVWEDINQSIPLIKPELRGKVNSIEENPDESEIDDEMGEAKEEHGSQQGDAAKVDTAPALEISMDQDDEGGIL